MNALRSIVIYLEALLLFFASCSNKQRIDKDIDETLLDSAMYTIYIDTIKKKRTVNMSDFFSRVKTIILETHKDAMLGRINRLLAYGDSLFILDKTVGQGVFIFNKSGKYLGRIGRMGQGPGEYTEISDFGIDEDNRILYVLDPKLQRINFYHLFDGSFINAVSLDQVDVRSFHLVHYANNFYTDAFYSPNVSTEKAMLCKIDGSSGLRTKFWLKSDIYNLGWNEMFFVNNVFYPQFQMPPKFIQPFMNTVMAITADGIIPYVKLVTKDWLLQKELEEFVGTASERYGSLRKTNHMFNINNYVEFDDLIYFEYNKGMADNYLFYNKRTSKTVCTELLINDLLYDSEDLSVTKVFFSFADSSGVYGHIHPLSMNNFVNTIKNGRLNPNLDKIEDLRKLDEASNPVLFYFD